MHPMLNVAIHAIRKGGKIIIQNYDAQKFIKQDVIDKKKIVSNIIYSTYKTIRAIIYKFYPNHIISNNMNFTGNIKDVIWIINALDGKNNFVKHFPHFCISISVIIKNNIEISVIYDPLRNDLFTAVQGQGSQLNGYRTRCSNVSSLRLVTMAINLPLSNQIQYSFYLKMYQKLILSGIDFRCTGSSMLDLAYVSSGRIDCIFDFNSTPMSFLIGRLQARESGCLINDFKEEHKNIDNNFINLIGNFKCMQLIIETIRECFL